MLPLSRIIISKFKTGEKKKETKQKLLKNFIPSVRAIELYQYVSNMSKKRKEHRLKRFFAHFWIVRIWTGWRIIEEKVI